MRVRYVNIGLLTVFAATGMTAFAIRTSHARDAAASKPKAAGWRPKQGDAELVLVYVASPSCSACRDPDLPDLVRKAASSVAEHAQRSGVHSSAIGVIVSNSVSDGVAFLKGYGAFDEIAIGNSWRNSGVLLYLSGDNEGPLATPQVIVLSRRWTEDAMRMGADSIVVRLVGIRPIADWVNGGARWAGSSHAAPQSPSALNP